MPDGFDGSVSAEYFSFCIVIPACNEANNLVSLLREIEDVVRTEFDNFEIVVVDDGSTDGTLAALRVAPPIPQLRVVSHTTTRGQSAAICTGVRAARAQFIVTLDGDGQNDPADITRLVRIAMNSATSILVVGRRTKRMDSMQRRWLSWLLNRFSALILRHPVMDKGCGLKVFGREDFLALPKFDHMHRFLPPLFQWLGVTPISISVNHRPRLTGESHYSVVRRLLEAVVDVVGIVWLSHRFIANSVNEIDEIGICADS
jgi:dolichol-phosphate mannosyltransferase